MKICIALSTWLLIAVHGLCGQATPQSFGQVAGVVRDSLSHAPILRGHACAEPIITDSKATRLRCGSTDSAGRYRIDSVGPGVNSVRVDCSQGGRFKSRELAHRNIDIAAGATIEWNIEVATPGCDQGPMERLHGRITGLYYNPDFETRWFFADGRTDQHAEASFAHSGAWPDVFESLPGNVYGLGCVRVTFAGRMQGPMSSNRNEALYLFDVDSIMAARPVATEQCIKQVERFLPSIRSIIGPRGDGLGEHQLSSYRNDTASQASSAFHILHAPDPPARPQ